MLERAIETDPGYAHVYRYLGMAYAEIERLDAAEAALTKAIALEPTNFVFPLTLGIVLLDAGQPSAARHHLRSAEALAPDSLLVAGYQALADWDDGRTTALAAFVLKVRDLPHAFRARVLVRLEERRLTSAGPAACIKAWTDDERGPAESSRPPRRLDALGARCRFWEARVLLWFGALARAADCLAGSADHAMSDDARRTLDRTRSAIVAETEQALAEVARNGDRGRRVERRRRALLLRLGRTRHDMGDEACAYDAVERWLESYERDGRPSRDAPTAAELLSWAAEVDVGKQRFALATERCARARRLARLPRVEWVDAIARLGLGERREARRRFERFLDLSLFDVAVWLASALGAVA